MANKVNILDLDINTSALISKMSATRAEIDKLKSAQKELTNNNQSTSDSFTKNEVELKRLQSSYTSQKNVVAQLTTANESFATATEAITAAIGKEITSISSVRQNNSQLLTLRNELNLATVEGQLALTNINVKLDENNAFIKANVSAYEQQKIAIGDYKNQIQEAFQGINLFNGGIGGFIARSQEAGGAGNLLTTSFKGMTSGMYGMVKASLAFLATPIGAAIGLLALAVGLVVGAFKFMTASMNSTEAGSQKLAKVTAAISGIFQGLFMVVKPLGEYLGGVFIKSFELASAAADKAAKIISGGLKLLGFTNAAKGVDAFTGAIKDGSAAAVALAAAQGKLDIAQRQAQKTQLDYQKSAEKLRQIRDDESLSMAQRTKANNDLGIVLKQQLNAELSIARQALLVANLRIKAEGKSKEALEKQAEALTLISDIQERVVGQESEQLVNINSLRKEGADKAKEIADKAAASRQAAIDKAIQQNKDELDLFLSSQGIKKKSVEDELKFAEDVSTKKLAILKKEFDAGKISKTAYESEKLNISNEFLKKQVDITITNAQTELDTYKKGIEQKIVDDTFFTQEKLVNKQSENDGLALKESEFQALKLQQGVINQTEYDAAIDAIKDATRIKNDEAQLLRDEAKKGADIINLENQRILDEDKFTTDFALQTERENIRYQAELSAANKSGADTTIITAKHALAKEKIEDNLQASKIAAMGASLGIVSDILGKESAAGKAAAIAQAVINTYQGITAGIKLGYPAAIPAVAAATVAGFGAVKNIVNTKVPTRADGGAIPSLGNGVIDNGANVVPLSNGDNTLAYVKQGEVILNKEQQRAAGGSHFFRGLGVPGFNGGGVVGGNTNLGTQGGFKIDLDALAFKISQANRNLPAPVVSVTDISYHQNRVAVIENGANL